MTSDRKESSPREARARDRVRLRLLDPPHQARLADAAVLVVVPDHDLVGRVAWVAAAADEREQVAPVQHLDDADAAAGEDAPERLLERLDVEDAEAGVGAAREAAKVLVEADEEQLVLLALREAQRRHRARGLPTRAPGTAAAGTSRARSHTEVPRRPRARVIE